MLIGLVSDTHIAYLDETLPPQIRNTFKGVDLILHAGDIWIPSVLDELESIAPVVAVWGDDDMEADLGGDRRMTKERTLLIEGVTFWLTHVIPSKHTIYPQAVSYLFSRDTETLEDPPDIVVYGHTHVAKIERYNGVLLVNPGSATIPNGMPKLGTVALLTVDSGEVDVRIVNLEDQPATS